MIEETFKEVVEIAGVSDKDLCINYLSSKNMEFSINLHTKQQKFSGSTQVELCKNELFECESDTDIDEEPLMLICNQ